MTPRNKPLEKRPAAADDDDDDDGQARYRVQDCDPARADDTLQLAPPFAQTIQQFAQNFLTGNSALAKSANFLAGGLDEITIRAQRLNVIEEYSVPFGPSAAPPVLNRPPMENCFAMERGDERAMVFTVEQKRHITALLLFSPLSRLISVAVPISRAISIATRVRARAGFLSRVASNRGAT